MTAPEGASQRPTASPLRLGAAMLLVAYLGDVVINIVAFGHGVGLYERAVWTGVRSVVQWLGSVAVLVGFWYVTSGIRAAGGLARALALGLCACCAAWTAIEWVNAGSTLLAPELRGAWTIVGDLVRMTALLLCLVGTGARRWAWPLPLTPLVAWIVGTWTDVALAPDEASPLASAAAAVAVMGLSAAGWIVGALILAWTAWHGEERRSLSELRRTAQRSR